MWPTPPSGSQSIAINADIPIDAPWSIQRLIMFGGITITSTESGDAIGNPIYSTVAAQWQLRWSDNNGDQATVGYRRTYCQFMEQGTVATPNVDRRGIWWLPADFWEFDIRLRGEGGGAATVFLNVLLQGSNNGPNPIDIGNPGGRLYMRILESV